MFSSELSGWPKVSVMMTATYVMIVSYTDDSRKCNQVLFSLRDLKTNGTETVTSVALSTQG